MLAMAGCYADLRPGISAPVGHGHGGAGTDLGVAFGGEHVDDTLRIGGGITTGVRLGSSNSYLPVGIDGHMATLLAPNTAWLAVAHVSVGYARGLSGAPGGIFNTAFAGIGLGSTAEPQLLKLPRGHVAVGPSATWFRAESGNSYWFFGAALELSFGWLQR